MPSVRLTWLDIMNEECARGEVMSRLFRNILKESVSKYFYSFNLGTFLERGDS